MLSQITSIAPAGIEMDKSGLVTVEYYRPQSHLRVLKFFVFTLDQSGQLITSIAPAGIEILHKRGRAKKGSRHLNRTCGY